MAVTYMKTSSQIGRSVVHPVSKSDPRLENPCKKLTIKLKRSLKTGIASAMIHEIVQNVKVSAIQAPVPRRLR